MGANNKIRKDSPDMSIITLYDKSFLATLDKKPTLGDVIGDKLRAVEVDPGRSGPVPASLAPKGPPKEIWVVRAFDKDGSLQHYDAIADEVKKFIETLVRDHDYDPSKISLFKPVKLQTKVQIVVDFES